MLKNLKALLLKWTKKNQNGNVFHTLLHNAQFKVVLINLYLGTLIIFFIVSLYFGRYLGSLQSFFYFALGFLYFYNNTFQNFITRFREDNNTIQQHLEKDFYYLNYFFYFANRTSALFFFFFFFFLSESQMKLYETLFFRVTYFFVILMFFELFITMYIIFYKNKPVQETFATVAYHAFMKVGAAVGVIHFSSHVPFFEPNPVSVGYHKYSPLGRGYGTWSTNQLLQIDFLKTKLGSDFNFKEIIDDNKMVNPTKLENYFKKHNLDWESFAKNQFPDK